MEVTYKMTRHDWQESFRIGLPCMSPVWWVFLLGYLLACPGVLLWAFWTKGYHTLWPPVGPFAWHTFAFILAGLCFGISTFFPTMLFMWVLTSKRTVRIDPLTLTIKSKLGAGKLKWNEVLEILDTGEYLCFRTYLPAMTVIPRSAFPNKEQAHAFAEQAGLYWRRATGRKDPQSLNAPGIWPPPPSAPNLKGHDSLA